MNRQYLLDILPPPDGKDILLVDEQTVRDIVKEVLEAHKVFAKDYDLIAPEFCYRNYDTTLKGLFDFCKYNLRNDTEDEDLQTTNSPTILLEKGHCDCKGYAGFIGGVLDACNRQGYRYNWSYRFAEYDHEGKIHHHVFIVAKIDNREIWIDPVLDNYDNRDPYPDRYFDRKISALTAIKKETISGIIGRPLPAGPKGISVPQPLGGYQTSTIGGPTGVDAAVQAAASNLPFKGARAGLLLPSIPGYPTDLPQLQLSPDGRLCFYTWPLTLTSNIWIDLSTHQPITGAFSTLDWINTYLRLATLEKITQTEYNQLKSDFQTGISPFDFGYYNISPGLAAGWYKLGRPHYWIFLNIQYYIDRYLKNPYGINALISYGTNWCDQFKAAIMGGQSKLITYLEGCSFLIQPVGNQNFWDKFYLAAPLIISAAAAIVTAGAATPALALAIANLAVKAGEASAAKTAAQTLIPQGPAQINLANVQGDLSSLESEAGYINTQSSNNIFFTNIMSWMQNNPLPAASIGIALLLIIYELTQE